MIAELGLDMSVDILAKELEILLKTTSAGVPKPMEMEETGESGQQGGNDNNSQNTLPSPLSPQPQSAAVDDGKGACITIEDTVAPVNQSPSVPSSSDMDRSSSSCSPSPIVRDDNPVVVTAPLILDPAAEKDSPSILCIVPVNLNVDVPIKDPLIVPATAEQRSPPKGGRILESITSIDGSQDSSQSLLSPTEEAIEVSSTIAVIAPHSESDSATNLSSEISKDKDTAPLLIVENVLTTSRPQPIAEPSILFPSDEPLTCGSASDSVIESTPHPHQLNPLEDSKSNAKDASESDEASSK